MFCCLAGLPRSGSTLLAAILNQHPDLHVSSTSPLFDFMGALALVWERSPAARAQGSKKKSMFDLLRAVQEAHCRTIEKKTFVDKNRGWVNPKVMQTMAEVMGAPVKIIATVRHIPDCAASFVRVAKPTDVKAFLRSSPLIQHLKSSYASLSEGYAASPDCFHFVDYDVLLDSPSEILAGILSFLGLAPFTFNLERIDGTTVSENDEEAWGVPGLHDVKPIFQRQHDEQSRDALGTLYATFLQEEFWKPSREPRKPQILDLQRDANLRGDFDQGWEYAKVLQALSPDDDRAAFNRGHHLLRGGDLAGGLACLDRGRAESIFGNPNPSGAPLWDGRPAQTVLLNLEGGLGDQIHGVRFARDIAAKGCEVIVSASRELVPLLTRAHGVTALCAHAGAAEVYHESWVPAMSAPLALGWNWSNVSGEPYLSQPLAHNRRPRIGLRWSGNPKFEHEQHRRFPPREFFDSVFRIDCDFISLQKDNAEDRPQWVEEGKLDSWLDTMEAIASCDLIISSCTSVAHLAGAMGVATWIVVPIMPYYLWSLPGETTPWYSSVRLFRQSDHRDWHAPMAEIAHELGRWLDGEM